MAGGGQAALGNSLIGNTLSGVNNLSDAGSAAAEPAARQQLGEVLNFAKGLLWPNELGVVG